MKMVRAVLIVLVLTVGVEAFGETVGLWKDGRSYIRDGMLKTLHEAGWETVILEKNDLCDETKLAGLDVIFLPGGWNAHHFAGFKGRRNLVRFTAGGKGVLSAGFRGGYVRTTNRPLFPQVGVIHNRVNGAFVWGYGDSELAKAIDKPFCPGGWDHLVVRVGPLGKVFAVSGDDPVGAYGDIYGGRYVVFGTFIGIDAKTEAMKGTDRRVFLAMFDWLAAAPELSEAEKAKLEAEADIEFLRREMLYDWTLNERGPDKGPGILPVIRNRLAVPLESRLYALQYMSQFLSDAKQKECEQEIGILEEAVEQLDRRYEKELGNANARIGKMSLKKLLADNPFVESTNLTAKVESVPLRSEEEKNKMLATLKRCATERQPPYASKELAMYLHGDALKEKLMSKTERQKLVEHADKVIVGLKPLVKAAKQARVVEERKQDLAMIPDLVKACSSDDTKTRREAVTELGRIGAPKTAGTLITMLDDPDEKVRIDAIIALGWMQSKEAVPELIKLAQEKDILMKRRAIQALGQIGDARAVNVLVVNTKDQDFYTAENAILALGWLKAESVVPELLRIVTESDREDTRQRGLMLAAIRALGHIGDQSALPALEKLEKETDDFPAPRGKQYGNGKTIANIYSTAQSLGLKGHAQLAIAEIKSGGRKEKGIKQAGFLASRDKFYGLTRRFNALAGRLSMVRGSSFKDDPAALWPYLWEAGFTGIHQAWGEQDSDPEQYLELVRAAGDFDLLWIDVMPTGGNQFGARKCSRKHGLHGVEKPGAEVVLLEYEETPAFQGFWTEETYPDISIDAEEFGLWLKSKYGDDFRGKLGLADDFDMSSMQWNTWSDRGGFGGGTNIYSGPLKTEFLQCCAEKLLASWCEAQEWLQGVRKGCAFTFSVSCAQIFKYPGITARMGTVIDVNGPENYQCFGHFNSFYMEMHKDGEARPAMSEFYNWYSPSPAHDVRGFAQHLMHGECFYNFTLSQIFEQTAAYSMWTWDATRWDNAKQVFRKAGKIREYINVPESAANVGLLCSDLTRLAFDPINHYGQSLLLRWHQHQSALYTALNQSQIPADVIWTETMTPDKLKRYKVLVLSDTRIVTEKQAELLREWVNAGGILITTGATSLFNQWAEQQKNYVLADLFGVDYCDNVGISDPDRIDTYCWKPGGDTMFKAVSGLDPDNSRNHVHRDLKPVKSIGTYTVCEKQEEYLPGIDSAMPVEYDMPLGYDKVKPISAEVLAKFANGDPALTVNKVGKGLCYFWTPIYPGLCHVTSEWEMQPNRLEFWPNVRELLDAMVKGGLDHQTAMLPVEVSNVSKEIEVTVRQQPEHNRWMIHLLNYDPKVDLVKSPDLLVHPPKGRTVKRICYPDTDTELKFNANEKGVGTKMRDFNVHDMVVVEYE